MKDDPAQADSALARTLARTLRAIDLDPTLPPLPTDVTITPQTLHGLGAKVPEAVAGQGGDDNEATIRQERAFAGRVLSTGPLPRISVHDASSHGRLPHAAEGPDLELYDLLGRGGMGEVYVGRQRTLARDVAVKRPAPGAGPATVEALCHEAMVAGHLAHPNVVPIYALGTDEQHRPLVVMKQIEGSSWASLLRQDAAKPGWPAGSAEALGRHLHILQQICHALEYAHSRRIVHRDIKPDNVMVGAFGEVYLLDWALALRLDRTHGERMPLLGTPAYMAPEMVGGGEISERTDVYLLGATLHEVLTGETRHKGGTLLSVLAAAERSDPVDYPAQVPEELAQLANRATAADPAQRPPTAAEFRQAIEAYEGHRGSLLLSRSADERLARIERLLESPAAEAMASFDRLVDEARFGYRQALAQWPDNAAALSGLQRCCKAVVRREIDRRNLAAAEAALAELEQPCADLDDRVAELAADLEEEAREQQRLVALSRELDGSAGAGMRRFVTWLYLAAVLGASAVGALLRPSAASAVLIMTILLAITIGGIVVVRRQLLVNAFNRRLVGWFVTILVGVLLNRVLGMLGQAPVSMVLVADMALIATMLAVGGQLFYRWLWIGAGLIAAAAFGGAIWPAQALVCLRCSLVLTLICALLLHPRERRQQLPEDPADR